MSQANAQTGKVRGYGLVRDGDGRPVFDNWNMVIPEPIMEMLTEEDLNYIQQRKEEISNVTNPHNGNP